MGSFRNKYYGVDLDVFLLAKHSFLSCRWWLGYVVIGWIFILSTISCMYCIFSDFRSVIKVSSFVVFIFHNLPTCELFEVANFGNFSPKKSMFIYLRI